LGSFKGLQIRAQQTFGQVFKDDVNDNFFMQGRRLKLNVYLACQIIIFFFITASRKTKKKFRVFQVVKKSFKGILSQDEYYF